MEVHGWISGITHTDKAVFLESICIILIGFPSSLKLIVCISYLHWHACALTETALLAFARIFSFSHYIFHFTWCPAPRKNVLRAHNVLTLMDVQVVELNDMSETNISREQIVMTT